MYSTKMKPEVSRFTKTNTLKIGNSLFDIFSIKDLNNPIDFLSWWLFIIDIENAFSKRVFQNP